MFCTCVIKTTVNTLHKFQATRKIFSLIYGRISFMNMNIEYDFFVKQLTESIELFSHSM